MKKYLVLTVALVVGASFAFAGTLVVPFFRDMADMNNNATNSAAGGYIGIKNTTESDIIVNLTYTTTGGIDITDPLRHTYKLKARQGVGFRPFATTADEGPGTVVPNAKMRVAGEDSGSLTINWSGGNTDVVGRYTEFFDTTSSVASYTLPTLQ